MDMVKNQLAAVSSERCRWTLCNAGIVYSYVSAFHINCTNKFTYTATGICTVIS